MTKERKKFKFKKFHIFLIGLFVFILTATISIWIYLSPMLVSGKIVELSGKVLRYDKSSIILQAEDGTYNCEIKSGTYFVNNYEPRTGDDIVVIYNYDENIIEKNKNADDKIVEARRIYKQKIKEEP